MPWYFRQRWMTWGQLGFGWSSTVAVGLLLMNQWLIWKAPWTCSWSFWDSGQSVLDLEFPFYLQTYWTLVLVMKVGAEIWNLFSFASLALSLIDTSHLSKLVGKAWFILVRSLLQQGHFLTFLIHLSPRDQFQPSVTLINTFKFWATPATPELFVCPLHLCNIIDLLFACSLTGFGLVCDSGSFSIYWSELMALITTVSRSAVGSAQCVVSSHFFLLLLFCFKVEVIQELRGI